MGEPQISQETGTPPEAEKPPPRPGQFVKGQSGNPGGRPRGIARTVRDVLGRAAGPDDDPSLVLARFWAGVMADPNAKMEHRIAAADRLADRGWGKPPTFAPIEEADPLERERDVEETAAQFEHDLDELEARRRRHARQAASR